jgi:hypothetical protein
MGGVGSGLWRDGKKDLVENAVTFNASYFAARALPGLYVSAKHNGVPEEAMNRPGMMMVSVRSTEPGKLNLHFKSIVMPERTISLSQDIELFTTTIVPSGGLRWWVRCPRCDEKKENLYFPMQGGKGFFCRECSDLTHRSAQLHDKRFDGMKKNPERVAEILREAMENLDDPEKAVAALKKIQMME